MPAKKWQKSAANHPSLQFLLNNTTKLVQAVPCSVLDPSIELDALHSGLDDVSMMVLGTPEITTGGSGQPRDPGTHMVPFLLFQLGLHFFSIIYITKMRMKIKIIIIGI